MSQSELSFIIEGQEQLDIENWERTRTECFYIVMADRIITRTLRTPKDLFPLPWDKKKVGKKMTPDEIKELADQIKALQHG